MLLTAIRVRVVRDCPYLNLRICAHGYLYFTRHGASQLQHARSCDEIDLASLTWICDANRLYIHGRCARARYVLDDGSTRVVAAAGSLRESRASMKTTVAMREGGGRERMLQPSTHSTQCKCTSIRPLPGSCGHIATRVHAASTSAASVYSCLSVLDPRA